MYGACGEIYFYTDNRLKQKADKTMKVLIADNQPDVRSALRLLLEQDPRITTINEISSSIELVEQIMTNQPDLILLDRELSGGHLTEKLSSINSLNPRPRVIVLSGCSEAKSESLQAYGDYFVSKNTNPALLIDQINKCLIYIENRRKQ